MTNSSPPRNPIRASFVWQDMDIAPRYPSLRKFLAFWQRELEGRLHSVRVGSTALISPGEMRHVNEFGLH